MALIPVLIVAAAGAYLLTRHHSPDRRQEEATAALSSYLTAWSKADYAAMATHADVPAAGRALVRVVVSDREDGTRDRFYVTDLTGAKTSITSFLGTDLTHVKGLTQSQLDVACGDAATKLPPGLKVHTCQ